MIIPSTMEAATHLKLFSLVVTTAYTAYTAYSA